MEKPPFSGIRCPERAEGVCHRRPAEADTLGRPLPPGWDQSAQTVSLSEIGEAVEKWEEKLGNRELTVKDGERTLRSFLLRRPDGLTAHVF